MFETSSAPLDLPELFNDADMALEDHLVSDEFLDACGAQGVEPRIGYPNYDPSAFWRVAADTIKDVPSNETNTPADLFAARLNQMTIAAPALIEDVNTLRSRQLKGKELEETLDRVGRFHDLMYEAATAVPNVDPQALLRHLTKAVMDNIPTANFPLPPEKVIEYQMRGLQHERGFERMCEVFGRQIRRATSREDLKEGWDYEVQTRVGAVHVNIKASTSELDAKRGNTSPVPYAFDVERGNILLFTLLTDQDFEGFTIADATASARGEKLFGFLDEAAFKLRHRERDTRIS